MTEAEFLAMMFVVEGAELVADPRFLKFLGRGVARLKAFAQRLSEDVLVQLAALTRQQLDLQEAVQLVRIFEESGPERGPPANGNTDAPGLALSAADRARSYELPPMRRSALAA